MKISIRAGSTTNLKILLRTVQQSVQLYFCCRCTMAFCNSNQNKSPQTNRLGLDWDDTHWPLAIFHSGKQNTSVQASNPMFVLPSSGKYTKVKLNLTVKNCLQKHKPFVFVKLDLNRRHRVMLNEAIRAKAKPKEQNLLISIMCGDWSLSQISEGKKCRITT